MIPGSVVSIGKRDCVLISINGALRTVAPIIATPKHKMPGDVPIGPCFIRVSSTAIAAGAMIERGHVGSEILAECLKWFRRCTLTAQIVAKHSPLGEWHRDAANERTAVR